MMIGPDSFLTFGSAFAAGIAVLAAYLKSISASILARKTERAHTGFVVKIELNGASEEQVERLVAALKPETKQR